MHLNFIPSLQEYLNEPSGHHFCLIYISSCSKALLTDADDQKIIPQKLDRYNAAAHLNALYQFGHIEFAPHKTFSLIISLKTSEHPPLFLNDYNISEIN